MKINELQIYSFRNLRDQSVDFSPQVTIFVGRNGQGKTSLLEAIFILSHGKSFRGAKPRQLIQWSSAEAEKKPLECEVRGRFDTADGPKEVICRIRNGKRVLLIDGKAVEKASRFFGQTRSIVFTPEELQLIKGAPALRRQFMDRILAMADSYYVENLVHYGRALKSRNKLLERRLGRLEMAPLLRSWDVLLARHAVVITQRRQQLVAALSSRFARIYSQLAGNGENAACYYHSELAGDGGIPEEKKVVELYQTALDRDLRKSATTLGPHRDELRLEIDTGTGLKDSRAAASQGQARTMALALTIAACELLKDRTGDAPILLLDDVESELDQSRRAALAQLLQNLSAQVIITATDVSRLAGELNLSSKLMGINAGQVGLK